MQNCYKIVVNCFYDFDVWTSEDALFIDKCSQSTKTEVTVFAKDLGPFETTLIGNPYEDQLFDSFSDPTSTICSPGAVGSLFGGYMPSNFGNLFSYNFFRYAATQFNRGTKHVAFFEN